VWVCCVVGDDEEEEEVARGEEVKVMVGGVLEGPRGPFEFVGVLRYDVRNEIELVGSKGVGKVR